MESGRPSRTAFAAAVHRAAHQVLEDASIFRDPLSLQILGDEAEPAIAAARENLTSVRMRLFIAARTHFAETALSLAVAQGTTQLVVLGAGLDTFAYRNPWPHLRVLEVDYPATQAWKRERLARNAIAIPESLTYAPVDFEHQTLAQGLASSTFDSTQPTFFTWLGVVPYLTEDAIWATLTYIAGLPGGAHVVFDYSDPPHTLSLEGRDFHDARAARVAALGEPWKTYFEADLLHPRLATLGLPHIEDLGPSEICNRYFPSRNDPPKRGGHFLLASNRSPNHRPKK